VIFNKLEKLCILLVLLYRYITMLGPMNIKNKDVFLQPGIVSQFLVRLAHSIVAIVTGPPKIPNFEGRPKIHVILNTKQTYAVYLIWHHSCSYTQLIVICFTSLVNECVCWDIFQRCTLIAIVILRCKWALTWLKNICYNGRWFVLSPCAGARDWISPPSTGGLAKLDNRERKRWQILCASQ
jgi:hypothetical protein